MYQKTPKIQVNQNKSIQRNGISFVDNRQLIPIQRKLNNTGLPDKLKSGIENLSGHSMDDVKVHYNSSKPAQLNAHAYAQGTNIHVASGQEKHLPHEAWHVVQQKQGRVKPTIQMKGGAHINDDAGLEKEADVMGGKALQINTKEGGSPLLNSKVLSNPIQRKVGVEYQTTWLVQGDNRKNHKKKIISGSSWFLESDNNELEFVSYPPASSPEALKSNVKGMSKEALKIKAAKSDFDKKTIGNILGGSVTSHFKDEHFKQGRDQDMSAKAQFSFGLSLKNMESFLQKMGSGNIKETGAFGGSKKFNFKNPSNNKEQSTQEFIESNISGSIKKSEKQRDALSKLAIGNSPEMKGFLAYLAYSMQAMQVQYGDTTEDNNKAAHLAQEILKAINEGKDVTFDDIIEAHGYSDYELGTINRELDVTYKEDSKVSIASNKKKELNEFVRNSFEKGLDYPKNRFIFMNRSGFDKMYQSLPSKDRLWFGEHLDEVMEKLKVSPDAHVFASPFTYKKKKNQGDKDTDRIGFSKGPTLKDWLKSIVASKGSKRDALSPPKEFIMDDGHQDSDQSLGYLAKMDKVMVDVLNKSPGKGKLMTKEKRQTELAIFELRAWGDYIKPEHWPDQSYDMAFLHGQMAKGDLTSEKDMSYFKKVQNKVHKYELLKSQVIPNNAKLTKGQKTHRKQFNRGLRNKMEKLLAEIEVIRKEHYV